MVKIKTTLFISSHTLQYILKKSSLNTECPTSGPNEQVPSNHYSSTTFCLLSFYLTIPTTSRCFFYKQVYFSLAWYNISQTDHCHNKPFYKLHLVCQDYHLKRKPLSVYSESFCFGTQQPPFTMPPSMIENV